jgi:hypothetical protein
MIVCRKTLLFALLALWGLSSAELHAQQPLGEAKGSGSLFPRAVPGANSLAGLELALAPEANAESGDKSKPGKEQPKRIVLPSWATGNKAEAWDDYFRRNEATHAAVRETVRALMAEKKYDDVIGVVEGALRQKQSQPWMYEALGIALQLSGRPAAEIERVMMSAVDFGNGTGDLVRVAYYLSHWMPDDRGLAKRALQLYRQATEQTPNEAEIYTHSLALAQRWNDLDALEWSLAGILRFPWPHSQRHIPENAQQIADTTFKSMVDKMQVDRAAAFKRTIDAARIRDCVIRVSWIGTADIDLLVEDPSGSICTYSQPRSAGGGVLLRDSQAAGADTRDETTKFEEYVCAEGLNGRYRMQVRRIWGKVNGDKVSIDFWTQRGTPNEVRQRQVLDLKDGELVANFDVAGARRTSIDIDPKLATTVNYQLAIGKSILAQQLGGPQSLTTRADQLPVSTIAPRNFFGAQAGYRPLIITLPTGANLQATAVVSNDRRYVRITSQPVFSSIPTVNVYNFGSGGSFTYAPPNAPNSSLGPPNSPGTPGACAPNPRGCTPTPPVAGFVALLHPNSFVSNGQCASSANPFVDEAGDFVTPKWTAPPRLPPSPTIPDDALVTGSLNGLPAITFPPGKVLRTKTEQSVTYSNGMHIFIVGAPPNITRDNSPYDVLIDYRLGNAGPPFPVPSAGSVGFTIYLDQRRVDAAAGVALGTGDRFIDSLTAAISTSRTGTSTFYFGRTNSQDQNRLGEDGGTGATNAIHQVDIFDFGFRDNSNPNGGLATIAPFDPVYAHYPLPFTNDPLDPGRFGDWVSVPYNNTFSYRFYKSNAAWDSYAPPAELPLLYPRSRDVTLNSRDDTIAAGGKPMSGLNGYWPQNECNFVSLDPMNLYPNRYDELFNLPEGGVSSTTGTAQIPPFNPVANPRQDSGPGRNRGVFPRITLGGVTTQDGNPYPGGPEPRDPSPYTNRLDDLKLSIVVVYPSILTFDEANQVVTWLNCWSGAVSYDRSADPTQARITDDRRFSRLHNWPYTIP